jgi:hypothetical protein
MLYVKKFRPILVGRVPEDLEITAVKQRKHGERLVEMPISEHLSV